MGLAISRIELYTDPGGLTLGIVGMGAIGKVLNHSLTLIYTFTDYND